MVKSQNTMYVFYTAVNDHVVIIGVAVDDLFSQSQPIPPGMPKLTYFLRFWGKKIFFRKIHQTPRIFNETGGSAKWENVKFSSSTNMKVLQTNQRRIQ